MASIELGVVAATARRIADGTLAAHADSVDAEARWPVDGVRELQAELGGLVVAERFGGLGHGLLAVAMIGEITGARCASTSLCFGMHLVGSAVLGAQVAGGQQDHLREIAAGRHLTTLALSEPGTGSEFWLPQTRMETGGDGDLRLWGTKSFVTNGTHADSYVLNLVEESAPAVPGRFSMVLLDGDTPGLEWGPVWHGLGMRGNDSRSLRLRGVRVPRGRLLGKEGDQTWYVFNVVAPYFLMAMSGTYLGVADAALRNARAHLQRRRHVHSGRHLSSIPVLQHRLAEMWARVERSRRLIYHAAEEAQVGGADALVAICSAKADVAQTVEAVTNDALTLLGGIGYGGDAAAHRQLRDGRAAHVMSPTTDILRSWVGRALLDESLLGQ